VYGAFSYSCIPVGVLIFSLVLVIFLLVLLVLSSSSSSSFSSLLFLDVAHSLLRVLLSDGGLASGRGAGRSEPALGTASALLMASLKELCELAGIQGAHECMRPEATSVCDLTLLVLQAFSY
jgi:hypothetical protein